MKVCARPGCGVLVPPAAYRGLCPEHRAQRDRERGTAAQRGYGPEFARQRRRYAARIAAGEVIPCWRCGDPVATDFHLGHADNDRTVIRGPEHPACNLKAAGQARHR